MKIFKFRKLAFLIISLSIISISAISSKKQHGNSGNQKNNTTGTHIIDPRLVGKWMWTKGSDGAYYDNNGVYSGAAYGLAQEYIINADGSGTSFNHVYSTIGAGTSMEVNIASKRFFESDNQGHLGYFPINGTYKSSRGQTRALRSDELWNTNTNTGFKNLYQKLVFTTQGERQCFQVTASDGTVDTYFKMP